MYFISSHTKRIHVCPLVLSSDPLRPSLASTLSSRAFRPFTVFLPVSFGPAVSLSEPTAQKEPSFSPPLITQELTSRGHDPTSVHEITDRHAIPSASQVTTGRHRHSRSLRLVPGPAPDRTRTGINPASGHTGVMFVAHSVHPRHA